MRFGFQQRRGGIYIHDFRDIADIEGEIQFLAGGDLEDDTGTARDLEAAGLGFDSVGTYG